MLLAGIYLVAIFFADNELSQAATFEDAGA